MEIYNMPGHLVRRLQQNSTQIFTSEMRSARIDLTPVQFGALAAISERPGLDQAAIATAIAYDRATVGGVVERLIRKGLVDRTVSQRDRRSRELRLTPEGEALYAEALPVVRGIQEQLVAPLGDADRAEFTRLLRLILGTEGI